MLFEEVRLLGGKNSYESIKRYEDKAYDKVLVRMPKGKKEVIQAHADSRSQSVNSFINEAIDEKMERDKEG
jgi:predicted HicB family RNase H-like nuclease